MNPGMDEGTRYKRIGDDSRRRRVFLRKIAVHEKIGSADLRSSFVKINTLRLCATATNKAVYIIHDCSLSVKGDWMTKMVGMVIFHNFC